jgi:hypothetical protein
MHDDYLWDRSGQPDAEIQYLEELLSRLGRTQPQGLYRTLKFRGAAPGARWQSAIAAGVALLMSASWLVSRQAPTGWSVARVEGTPFAGSSPIRTERQLAVGEVLVTDGVSRAKLDVATVGQVELEPNSRLRLIRAQRTDQRLALDRGTLHAMIWAPPRLFSVETPAAVAVDYGCAYTLRVDDAGTTTLYVTVGWVGFAQNGFESWVPAGAGCVTRKGSAPGTPYFETASEPFRGALSSFDTEHSAPALSAVLANARPGDAMTLWHLLPRTTATARRQVYQRLSELAAPPAGVTIEGILNEDHRMLDLWWDSLNLGDSALWRMWKGPSPFAK